MNKTKAKAVKLVAGRILVEFNKELGCKSDYLMTPRGEIIRTGIEGLSRSIRRSRSIHNGLRTFAIHLGQGRPHAIGRITRSTPTPVPHAPTEPEATEKTVAPHKAVPWFKRAAGFMGSVFSR